jgi:hypothetical protein
MSKNKYRLVDWSASIFRGMPIVFWGLVMGNPKFKDGTFIHTSTVLNIKDCGNHKEVETRNSIYCIYPDEILVAFKEENPDAYEKLDKYFF